ncbi:hypothetical protein [Endozoicomonas euniceicola]|uniref:Uncharacterized protein n=1 Tax=Endozoicomonas euniceicola TaxID=1234143 RepID=A0ABY6GX01_9GAMM|nr:hypothetical protein [Endozoicomonas euniceicola]UYM17190.1 hypothetical protein NX720_04500 [Endozoicomonas euniceicola]
MERVNKGLRLEVRTTFRHEMGGISIAGQFREAAEHNIPLLAVGCWLLAVGFWLYEQLIANSQKPGKLLNAAPPKGCLH